MVSVPTSLTSPDTFPLAFKAEPQQFYAYVVGIKIKQFFIMSYFLQGLFRFLVT